MSIKNKTNKIEELIGKPRADIDYNEHGEPLRAWEKPLPENQTKLETIV